jgi:RNA polymerase sigma factor (sigma-70 family)
MSRLRCHLARLAEPLLTDAELLARYVRTADELAFAELVRRHGPAVLTVCRHVAGDRDDADDAFQATFLVLARKANRLRAGAPVGGWLYGVAVRAARTVRARAGRRRGRETAVAVVPDVPKQVADGPDADACRAVLEEVARLSDAYRAAVVLCELEGRPRSAAARELGIAEGTLSSRLAAARKLLADRLRKRGHGPEAALAAVGAATASPALAVEAVGLVFSSDVPSRAIIELAEAVMQTAVLAKWQLIPLAAVVVAVGLTAASEPAAPAQPERPAAAARPADDGEIVVYEGQHFRYLTPDGVERRRVAVKFEDVNRSQPAVKSPGGRWELVNLNGLYRVNEVCRYGIRPAGESGPGRELRFNHPVQFFWSPDGRELVGTEIDDLVIWPWSRPYNRHWRIDPATGKRTPLPIPADHYLNGYSADPDRFVTTMHEGRLWSRRYHLCLVSRDGKTVEPFAEPNPTSAPLTSGHSYPVGPNPVERFGIWVARDGRSALVLNWVGNDKAVRLAILDLKTRQTKPVSLPPGWAAAGVNEAAWSPDGSRIVVATIHQLIIIDARTGSARVIYPDSQPATARNGEDGIFWLIAWR